MLPDRRCPLHPDERPFGQDDAAPPGEPDIPDWVIVGHLASGGFADVYRAIRSSDGRKAALKVARRVGDPRFVCERSALDRVGAEIAPQIVDAGDSVDGRPWLALRHLRGSTLGMWMAGLPGTGACEPLRAVAMLRDIAAVVDRMHQTGVVHRDLKPDNIMIGEGEEGRALLLDFGIAKVAPEGGVEQGARPSEPASDGASGLSLDVLDESLTVEGQRLGTVLYAAPEQSSDPHSAGVPADLYAFAAIAFELITGRPPFIGTVGQVEHAHAVRRVPLASGLATLPSGVDRVFRRGLAKAPDARYQSALALVADLDRACREEVGPASTVRTASARAEASASSSLRVAIMAVRTARGAFEINELLAHERGHVARIWGRCTIVAFRHASSPAAGIRAAMRLARALPTPTRVIIHVADVELRHGVERTSLASLELDEPGWMPSDAGWEQQFENVILTDAATAELAGHGHGGRSGEHALASLEEVPMVDTGSISLRGRDRIVHQVVREARHCLGSRVPGMVAIIADTGMGKSRVLHEVSECLAGEFNVERLQVPTVAASPSSSLLAQLASVAMGMDVKSATADALRDACVAGAGSGIGLRGWAELMRRLGLHQVDETRSESMGVGGYGQALSELLSICLGRRAREESLALCIDDADRADGLCIEVLERATAGDGGTGPWVLLAGSPELLRSRPELGRRAMRYTRHDLGTLPLERACDLLRELLHPVERVPDETLTRIAEMARGVPLYLVEIVDVLRSSGAIRRRRGAGAWFLASDELFQLSATPLAERLAQRKLEALPEVLGSFAMIAAVLGETVFAQHVDEIRTRLENQGALDFDDMDTGVALARLQQHGLMRKLDAGHYEFRHPMLRSGLEARMDASTHRQVHQAVYDWLGAGFSGFEASARRAHHAAAAGHTGVAARAWIAAAQAASEVHEHVRAGHYFSAAIEHISATRRGHAATIGRRDADILRLCALHGRAKTHTRLERWHEAEADLQVAYQLARALGDEATAADCLLDMAMVYDWTYRWAQAVECVDRVEPLVARLGYPRLEAGYLMARGRCADRESRYHDALPLLDHAARVAREVGDVQTLVSSMLLIPVMLTFAGKPHAAERRFRDVIALCRDTADLHHLAVAFGNRILLWQSLGRMERALEDGRRAVELSRRMGHATLESTAGHNLAEMLYFQGEFDEALVLAERARDLYHRHVEQPGPEHDLLIARIQAALGADEALRQRLAALAGQPEDTWSDKTRLGYRALTLAADDGAGWREVVEQASSVCGAFPDEHMDLLLAAVHAATASGRGHEVRALLERVDEIAAQAADSWQQRFAPYRDDPP